MNTEELNALLATFAKPENNHIIDRVKLVQYAKKMVNALQDDRTEKYRWLTVMILLEESESVFLAYSYAYEKLDMIFHSIVPYNMLDSEKYLKFLSIRNKVTL